jgi:hypothetical protein
VYLVFKLGHNLRPLSDMSKKNVAFELILSNEEKNITTAAHV